MRIDEHLRNALLLFHCLLRLVVVEVIVFTMRNLQLSLSVMRSFVIALVPSFSEKAVAHLNASVPSPKSSHALFVVVLDIICSTIAIKKLQTMLVGFGLSIDTKPCSAE